VKPRDLTLVSPAATRRATSLSRPVKDKPGDVLTAIVSVLYRIAVQRTG
jgi:hypothetical protein